MGNMGEIGRIGQKRYAGIFYEEFLKELHGKKGIETYKEMAENDETIGAILFAIEMLIRQVSWSVEPGGGTAKDKEAAQFVEQCMNDMQDTWTDTISEILSFLTYGWSFHEIVYKRRAGKSKSGKTNSKYADGLIGWCKLPIRAQETLYEWKYDPEDNLEAMVQMPPPEFGFYTIPTKKALLFRTKNRKGNPEGRSILRNAYRSWYFKKRIQEIEGIGIERDLAGLPVMKVTEDSIDIYNEDDPEMIRLRGALESEVRHIKRDELDGIVLPYGIDLQLLSTGGSRQFDTNAIISRYNTGIAMTVLADFILLGHEKVGSFALSSDKTELFSIALGAFIDVICETFNSQGIPQLMDMNDSHFTGMSDYPKLTHGDIETANLDQLSTFINTMVGVGVLVPDDALEDYVREQGNLPERTEDTRQWDGGRQQQAKQNQPPEQEGKAEQEEKEQTEGTEREKSMAKKRLGR